MLKLFACVVTVMVLLAPSQAGAQTTWFKYEGNPVLGYGPAGGWDQGMVLATRVLFKDALYHMWYVGTAGGSASPSIGYATSPNGITWSKCASNPVLSADLGSWEGGGVVHAYIIFEDTAYKMWYQGVSQRFKIGYATSPDGILWTKYTSNPVFGTISWDGTGEGVYFPCVIPDGEGGYHMWYGANWMIGYAHGSSPTTWTPSTGPVVTSGRFPRVLEKSDGGYEMWHNGGYATSPDGITWTTVASNVTSLNANQYNVLFDGTMYHNWYSTGQIYHERVDYAVSPKGFVSKIEPSDTLGRVFVGIGDTVWIKVHADDRSGLSFAARIWKGTSVDSIQLSDVGDGFLGNFWVAPAKGTYNVDLNLRLHDTLRFGGRIGGLTVDVDPSAPDAGRLLAQNFALEQNYPNPFNPSTVIKYNVSGARNSGLGTSNTRLVVYDLLGREVAVLVDERKAPGSYEVSFDAAGLASGVYFYRLTAGSFVQSRKMLLVR